MSDVDAFLNSIEPERMREEAKTLDRIFRETTGWEPHVWNERLIGYGLYDYTYKTGRSGTSIATGFSPLKGKFSLYIMPGYTEFPDIQARLGKVKYAKSCAYVNKLDDINLDVLPELISAGLENLNKMFPTRAS